MKQWNITTDSMRKKLGTEFQKILQLRVDFSGSTNFDFTSQLRLYHVSRDKMVYNFPTNIASFSDLIDRIEISANLSRFPMLSKRSSIWLVFGASDFNTDLRGELDYAELQYGADIGSQADISFRPGSVHKSMLNNTGTEFCAAVENTQVCVAKCRINLIQKYCNCSPTRWPTLLSPGENDCSLAKYRECFYNRSEDQSCRDRCKYSCKHLTYHVSTTKKDAASEHIMQMTIFVDGFTYVIYEDSYKMTLESFLSSLGGLLGLILGLDMRFLATLILTPLSICIGFCIQRWKKDADAAVHLDKYENLKSLLDHHIFQDIIARTFSIPLNAEIASLFT